MPNQSHTNQDVCTRCGKQRSPVNSGTLTGWIFGSSRCDCRESALSDNSQIQTVQPVCLSCNKAIFGQKKASITQWIFGRCTCAKPQPGNERPVEGESRSGANLNGESVAIERPGNDLIDQPTREIADLRKQLALPERYAVIRLLGRGGAAVVCEAWDTLLERAVAVKLIDRLTMEPEDVIRFQTEARITSSLSHPNIVTVLDFGVNQKNQPFMVLEHVTGITLREHLRESGPLAADEACAVFSAVASALAHAYKNGVSHRDIKPDNLILHKDAASNTVPKLIDFGVAKYVQVQDSFITHTGITLAGTPVYMSPEQFQGKTFDVRSEIYTFGCVLFESLIGSPPFAASSPLELSAQHCNEVPPEVISLCPPAGEVLSRMVGRCLRKEPDDRLQSFDEIFEILDGLSKFENQDEEAQEGPERKQNQGRSRPKSIIAAVFIVLISVSVSTLLFRRHEVGPQPSKKGSNDEHHHRQARKNTDTTYGTAKSSLKSPRRQSDLTTTTALTLLSDVAERPRILYSPEGRLVTLRGNFGRDDFLQIPFDKPIENLDAYSGQHLDPEGFKMVSKLPLKVVNLNNSDADERIFDIVAQMPKLEQVLVKSTALNDRSLSKIARLPSMWSLEIDGCNVSDTGLLALTKSPRLTSMSMNSMPNITKNGLSVLKKIPRLRSLSYSANPLGDDEIGAINQLRLQTFVLNDCGIDDRKAKLLRIKSLKTLEIRKNKLGIQGLQALMKLPSIRLITISNSRELTEDRVRALKKSLNVPCEVTFAPNDRFIKIEEPAEVER